MTEKENVDPILQELHRACEEMDKRDKTGMNAIDAIRPYQTLYNYLMNKLGNQLALSEEEAAHLIKTNYLWE